MMESRDHIGSGSVKGWHAAELAKFKAFHDRENNDHDIQNTKDKEEYVQRETNEEEEDLQKGVGDSMTRLTQLELNDKEEEEEEEEEGFKGFDAGFAICCTEGCKFCGHLAGYHGGEYGKDYKARIVMKKCYRCRKAGHWDEECAGYIKSERGDWFLKLLAEGCCIRLAQ
ncbi:hypothetical protein EV1_008116 [Malus domestica]